MPAADVPSDPPHPAGAAGQARRAALPKTKALHVPLGHLDLLTPIVLEESTPYGETLRRMREGQRGSVIVCNGGAVTGVFTERDYLYKQCLERVPLETPIGKLMSTRPVTVSPDTTLGEAVELMHEKRFRNLPVVDAAGKPQALLTVGRIIRYLAETFPAEVMNLPPTPRVTTETDGA
ncbi:MAG: CBS domain-containing protein [Elusimicrobia bacterium]|nr:CBS domain-containing protein [Elusimicrobiota bacterium]